MHGVDPQLYPTVIREMIRHENDLTNHRIMWLLIVQGLIANAAVTARGEPHGCESRSRPATAGLTWITKPAAATADSNTTCSSKSHNSA